MPPCPVCLRPIGFLTGQTKIREGGGEQATAVVLSGGKRAAGKGTFVGSESSMGVREGGA